MDEEGSERCEDWNWKVSDSDSLKGSSVPPCWAMKRLSAWDNEIWINLDRIWVVPLREGRRRNILFQRGYQRTGHRNVLSKRRGSSSRQDPQSTCTVRTVHLS